MASVGHESVGGHTAATRSSCHHIARRDGRTERIDEMDYVTTLTEERPCASHGSVAGQTINGVGRDTISRRRWRPMMLTLVECFDQSSGVHPNDRQSDWCHVATSRRIGVFERSARSQFPGLQDRVLSKCSDAHIYLDHGTCSPFQRWQSAFVSSGI